MNMIKFLANDKNIILYRKELNSVTKSVTATILLQQLIYWFEHSNYKPFYKFIEPCSNALYKKGDSWTEELGFSKKEFSTAYKKLETLKIVSKKIDISRVTYYSVDIKVLSMYLDEIYISSESGFTEELPNESPKNIDDLHKSTNVTYVSKESVPSEINNRGLVYSKSFDTETTTETTTENKKINKKTLETIDKITNYLSSMTPEEISLFDEYLDMRKSIKVRTTDNIKLRLLKKYFDGGRNPEMIENAISANWKDFYPVKSQTAQKSFKQQDKELLDSSIDAFFDAREKGFSLRNVEEPVSQYEDCEVIDYEP